MQKETNPLFGPKAEAMVQGIIAKQAEADNVARMAAAQPLPGPTRDAFAIKQDIDVGPYRVRPVLDIDIEFLEALKHPLHEMMVGGIAGQKPEANADYVPRGARAWELCWIMTRSREQVDEIEEALKTDSGIVQFRASAKKEFSRLGLAELLALNDAILAQLKKFWSPVLAFGPAAVLTKEGEQSENPQ